jgi:hypothetical protein
MTRRRSAAEAEADRKFEAQEAEATRAEARREARKMGRPSKLNDEVQDRILDLIEAGDRPEVAAGVAGVSRSTFFDWMHRGGQGEEPFATFRTEVTRALDVFESESRKIILEGDGQGVGFGEAKARLEVLSRRMPRQWAQQVKHHVETVEEEFFSALQRVCSDPAVHARVCQEKDSSFLFAAFCEELARFESEGEAPDPSAAASSGGSETAVH